ncbi:MAG TPA: DUF1553 domain-containing protein, partial [Flavobacteriales bacterium]|nr:DUF1553 domain-containing protein [Flavobacteriales bacterium]
ELSGGNQQKVVLAKWLATPENPFFAKAMANRLWSQFMGRGLVNPVDDMHNADVLLTYGQKYGDKVGQTLGLLCLGYDCRVFGSTAKAPDSSGAG